MSPTNRFRNPCRLRGFQFLTVTPAALSHNPGNRTCGAQPLQNHFGRASQTRNPATSYPNDLHPSPRLKPVPDGSAAMPGKKPKAGFPGWGLNPRIVTDPSIALTRSDLPDTHPSAHQTHPNLRRRSIATAIHDPKPKPSSAMPSESKHNRHKAGFSGFEGFG